MRHTFIRGAGAALLAAAFLTTGSLTARPGVSGAAGALPAPVLQFKLASRNTTTKPPTTAQCEQNDGVACYSSVQYQNAYDTTPLYNKGIDGKGTTIAIVVPFGYPGIATELAAFDRAFHLPAPPSLKTIAPAGKIPPYQPGKHPAMRASALETSLDVEYAHALAPGARLLVVATPVYEGLGTSGFPQITKAVGYVASHHLAQVISMSLGTAEQTFPSQESLLNLRGAFRTAAADKVSVLAASGDEGPSNFRTGSTFFTTRTASWPASDPLVTGVGGTQLFLTANGQRTQPDVVWNDTNLQGIPAATGGGRSSVFARPSYQNGVAKAVGSQRGVPDVSMSAAVNGAALVYLAGNVGFSGAGYYLIGGTSEAAPLFAGVVALADQQAGHGLGLLNPALYQLYAHHAPGLVAVNEGTNTVTFEQGSRWHTVPGWDAVHGYDLATGTGTIDAARFVPELAAAGG